MFKGYIQIDEVVIQTEVYHLQLEIQLSDYSHAAVLTFLASGEIQMLFIVVLIWQSISAYMGSRLSGKVLATFVGGNLVYKEGNHASQACALPILHKQLVLRAYW